MKDKILELTDSARDLLLEYRRHIHQNPELSFQEENTSAFIRGKLNEFGIPMQENVPGYSTIGYLKSGIPGPCIAFRADIDALPIQEENDLPFRSSREKVMHACGHDSHTAILLCLAKIISEHQELIRGEIRFLFQEGEEKLPGGAVKLVENHTLDGVDQIYALHIRSNMDVGQVNIQPGPRSAAIGAYDITITGKGGHSGFPHRAIDPATVAADIINSIYRIVPQRINPQTAGTVTVGYIHTDNAHSPNVISKSVNLGGSYRMTDNTLVQPVLERLEKLTKHICEANDCSYSFEKMIGYPAVINRGEEYKNALQAAETLGYENILSEDIMGGEDFAQILNVIPGAYFTIGTREAGRPETGNARHSGDFRLGESGMIVGLNMLLGTYLTIMEKY